MEQKWIDDFRTLARVRNFTKAALERNTTQPAFSRRIAQLEDWCGLPLFDRATQPISLTKAGAVFLKRAEKIHEEIQDTRRIMNVAGSHYKNALRLYTTNTIAVSFLYEWLEKEDFKNPFSLVIASVHGCMEAYKKGDADIVLIPQLPDLDLSDKHYDVVKNDYLRLYASAADTIQVENNVLTGDYLAYMPNTWLGKTITAYHQTMNLTVKSAPVCESASAEALLSLCKNGLGAAWLPDIMVRNDPDMTCIMPQYAVPYNIVCLRLTH